MSEGSAPNTGEQSKPAPLRLPRFMRWLREAVAILVWGIAFAQVMLFDLGSYVSERLPVVEPALRFRFLVLIGTIALLWLLLGNRRFTVFFGYIVAYPFIVAFWHLPRILFRNWAVVVAFAPAIHSVLTTFRTTFVLFVTGLISVFIVCLADSPEVVAAAMATLGAYLAIHYVRRFRVAFAASTAFADVGAAIASIWNRMKTSDTARRPEGLDPSSEAYTQKVGQNLLTLYMVSTSLHFVSEKLRDVVNSRKLDLYFLASLLYTFLLTSVVFAVAYFGLERVNPGSFSGIQAPGLVDFLGFSFSTLMTSDISPLRPMSSLAQGLSYLQLFGSLLIIVLLVFVILTSIRERYREDLDGLVDELKNTSDNLGLILESNFELTMAGTEALLLRLSPVPTKWFLKLRHGEERAKQISASVEDAG